jgi:HTH-type transcriptional regulator, transcriptional repressor of NAD biosynthesis genes
MRRALVIGKFMPLHRGHELLIESALAECDDVTVVVYDSEPPGGEHAVPMPLAKRIGWIRELYPRLEAIVALPDPVGWPDNEDPAAAEVYAEGVRFLGAFDRFYSSESRYERFASLIGARHVVVDEARRLVPVSGTLIRSDPYRYRGYVSPHVYGSLVRRVALVGTESSGKSTLARALAEALDTVWVHEYGRELWEAQGLQGTFADHFRIAERQRAREDAALRHAREYLFCDTNAWTTLQWSLASYGCADVRLHDLVDRTVDDYEWIVCADDFGWIQDGTRELDGPLSHQFQQQQVADLVDRGVRFLEVSGTVKERVAQVTDSLRGAHGRGLTEPLART